VNAEEARRIADQNSDVQEKRKVHKQNGWLQHALRWIEQEAKDGRFSTAVEFECEEAEKYLTKELQNLGFKVTKKEACGFLCIYSPAHLEISW
jgi:hypothetical protein